VAPPGAAAAGDAPGAAPGAAAAEDAPFNGVQLSRQLFFAASCRQFLVAAHARQRKVTEAAVKRWHAVVGHGERFWILCAMPQPAARWSESSLQPCMVAVGAWMSTAQHSQTLIK